MDRTVANRDEGGQLALHPSRVGTPPQFRWLAGVLGAVLVLNVADALLTLFWVRKGYATEENLFVRRLVNEHAPLFLAVKVSLVSLGCLLLWRRRGQPLAVFAIFGSFLAYYWVLLHHLDFASWLFARITRS